MNILRKVFFGLKNWRVEWDVDEELIKQEIVELENQSDIVENESEIFSDSVKNDKAVEEDENNINDDDWEWISKTISFFEK